MSARAGWRAMAGVSLIAACGSLKWRGAPEFTEFPAPMSLYQLGSRVEVLLEICGAERALYAHWIACGADRDVYTGHVGGVGDVGAFVVKVGSSGLGRDGNWKEWVKSRAGGYRRCVTPLLYAETDIEHCARTAERSRVTVLVESAVLTADVSVPAFFRGVLERSEVEVWSLAIYALGEILTCIGVAAWEDQRGGWCWRDLALWNAFFDHRGFCRVGYKNVMEEWSSAACLDSFGEVILQCVMALRGCTVCSMPARVGDGLLTFLGGWRECFRDIGGGGSGARLLRSARVSGAVLRPAGRRSRSSRSAPCGGGDVVSAVSVELSLR